MITTLRKPSFVWNASAGARFGLRLPSRRGRAPPLAKKWAIGSGRRPSVEASRADVEMLAGAAAETMDERGVHGPERVESGGQVGDGAADLRRRVTGHAGERHEATHPLRDRGVA